MAAAREGADWACKLVLPPQPKARGPLVSFPMPPLRTRQDCVDAMGGLLSATAAGLLSLDEAADFGKLIERYSGMLEVSELSERLDRLEGMKNVTPQKA